MNKQKHLDEYHIIVSIIAVVSLIVLGTIAFHLLENWTFIESFYFSVATLTTVGYGDLHPTYDLSRLFTAVYALFGVATTLGAFTVIATDRINHTATRMRDFADTRKERKENEKEN